MRQLLNLCATRPWAVLVLILLVSVGAVMQVGQVRIQVTADELLVLDDPERTYYDGVRRQFGDDQLVLLYVEDPDPFAPARLAALRGVIESIGRLPFVARVESLFSVPHLKTVDGYLSKEPYLATLPAVPEEAGRLRDEALKNPFLNQVLLARDGRVMAAAVVLREGVRGSDDETVVRGLREAVAGLEGQYQTFFTLGYPQIRMEIAERIRQEQGRLAPAAVVALAIALFALLRRFVDILIPFATASLSILWTLGVMGWVGIPLNVVTSIVPILLIVVGSTWDIHMLAEFRQGQAEGLSRLAAIAHMTRKMGRALFLTFLTTFVGFLSVGLSRIEVLWHFGLIAAVGLALNFIITISLIPALLVLIGGEGRPAPRQGERDLKWAKRYWERLHRFRFMVIGALVALVVAAVAGIPAIEVNHNPIDSLGEGSEVREQVGQVNRSLSGLETFSIVVDSGIQDTFLKVRYLEELVKLQRFVAEQGLARSSTSFADYLSLLNGAFQELDAPQMPQSDDVVGELMIFLDYDRVKGYVSQDYSTARILVRHHVSSSRELARFVEGLQGFIDRELDPGLRARITGDSVLTLSATRAMIQGQLQSIGLLLVFFIALIGVLFADLRVGLLAAIPNVVPILILFGVMGHLGIPLNIGTTMAAAIAIGIAVDDTMHLMMRYNQELKSATSQACAMFHTIRGEVRPVVATSVALIAGFLVFALSEFEPLRQFGLLSALVMAAALVADLLLTPLAMATLRLVTLWDLMSLQVRREVIAESPLFRGMRDWQIRRFILSSTLIELAPGQTVFRLGDPSDELYLVMSGRVEVRIPSEESGGRDLVVDAFGPGGIFGEVALLTLQSRRGNAYAMEPAQVLVLTREGIANATLHHPIIAARLFENLATDISHRWVRFISRARRDQISAPPLEDPTHAKETQPEGRDERK